MIELLDLEKVTRNLTPITSIEYTIGKSQAFHPEGLFSETIFGMQNSPDRNKTYSYINLYCKVIHPALMNVFYRLNRKILSIIKKEKIFSIDKDGHLVEDEKGNINGLVRLIANFDKVKFQDNDNLQRLDLIKMVNYYNKKGLVFINKILVIPSGYRDAVVDPVSGGLRIDPLNEYYVKILRSANQLQAIQSGEIYDVLSSKMNDLVLELYEFLGDKLGKKEGLIRDKILARRSDFTARAVIVGGSTEIKINQIGVPFRVLLKLFEPFIIYDLVNSGNVTQSELSVALREYNNSTLSIPVLRNLMNGVHNGDELTPNLERIMKDSVQRVIKDKVVIAKRDPALQTENAQGFYPVMIDGAAIKLNILKVVGFNADFDGDAMALYAPITKEAIEETKEKLVTSHSTKSLRGVSETFIKELPAGIYFLTMDLPQVTNPISIRDEAEFEKIDPRTRIRYNSMITTVGRVLFNRIMPKRYPYINEFIDKKKLIKLGIEIFNKYEYEVYVQWCSDVVALCAKFYTLSGLTFSLDDLELNVHLVKLKEKLSQTTDINEADKILKTIDIDLKDYLIKNGRSLGIFSASGADKGILQVRQILVAKGLIADSNGNPLNPISASIGDGLSSREYFYSGIGSRSGIVDRVINTSETGYLSRQLVYALQRVELSDRIKDCRSKRQVKLKVNEDLSKKLEGRYVIRESGKLDLFDPKKDLGEVIYLRSPLYCTSEKICYHCYGDLAAKNRTDYIGILAGHILGEPLSQSIMRSFHTGGSVSMFIMKVIDVLSKTMPEEDIKKLSKFLEQKDANIISKLDGLIKLDLKDYLDPKKDVLIDDKMISLNYGYFTIKTGMMDVDIILDTKVNIPLEGKQVIQKDNVIVINFKSNSEIFSVIPTSTSFLNKIKILISLLSGKQPWKNPDHFLMKVYNFFIDTNFVGDMVHVEVLVSNLLRDKGNPSYPARLNPNYNAMVGNLKNIPALESWLQSLNFENLNKSITTGLVYNRPESETLFEKIVTGNL